MRPAPVGNPRPGVDEVRAGGSVDTLPPGLGVLVMAHGGSDEWNASVRAAVAPLADELPTAIAFGMADPVTLQQGVDQLESTGVTRIAVIRLFISGDSFLHRTEYLFDGWRGTSTAGSDRHGSDSLPQQVTTGAEIAIDREGLVDAFETAGILRQRALALSRDPSSEAVLLLGHGTGDELENDRLMAKMESSAALVREAGFREVAVETLREDWADARRDAERQLRRWVADRTADGLRVLVVPFRLSGFGPYADVLTGLDYEADGLGLLPHGAITDWLRRRVQTVACTVGWRHVSMDCPAGSTSRR